MAKSKSKLTTADIFHMRETQVGLTLVAALRQWLPKNSWSEIRRLVRTRHVQVNGNLCLDEARRLKADEVVKVHRHPLAPPPKRDDVKIVYLDEHIVVVEKPSGVTSVRHVQEQNWPDKRKQFQPTLDEMLPEVIAKFTPSTPATDRPRRTFRGRTPTPVKQLPAIFPVHRLDRETSGLMVFARTKVAEQNLIQQFKAHSIERAYQAVAWGDVRAQRIETRLVRDRGDGIRGGTADADAGQQAVTNVRPLRKLGACTLVECRLETGRTHQIRIHLSELGHRVCGEKVYTRSALTGQKFSDVIQPPRLALHAITLSFLHPITGRKLSFSSELPRDLAQFVAKLKNAHQVP